MEGSEECLEPLFDRSVLCVLFDVEPLTVLFDADAALPGGGGKGGGIAYCAAGTEGGGGSPLPNECFDPCTTGMGTLGVFNEVGVSSGTR